MQELPNKAPRTDKGSYPDPPGGRMTSRESMRHGLILIGIQFSAMVVISIGVAIFDLDRATASLFYLTDERWFMGRDALWAWLYRYGTIPGALLTMGCLIAWLVTFFNRRLVQWRPYLLLVVLTTVIAGGILVNSVLKPYWGRPRPNQTTEFGGYYTYRHVFPPGTPGKGASFPCGHCTMGFTMLSLYFVKGRSKVLAYGGTAAGILLGTLLSAARIINGAHFLSDAIWSLGIVTMTAVALYYCVLKIPVLKASSRPSGLSLGRKFFLITMTGIALLLIVSAFMTRRPFFKTVEYYPPIAVETERLIIELNTDPEKLVLGDHNRDITTVLVHAHGFGWANVDYDIRHAYRKEGNHLILSIQIDPRSYFAELDHTVEVIMPARQRDRLKVLVNPDEQESK